MQPQISAMPPQSSAEKGKTETRPRSVSELLSERFFIPDYQRGYKWEESHVEQLLDDLKSAFRDKGQEYSLQPVIVAKKDGGISEWEVIDGQQRLTTLHLILRYLEAGEFKFSYDTRADSTPQMLEILRPGSAPDCEVKWNEWVANRDEFDTPDNYHLFHAWQAIAKWFQKGNGKNLTASDAGFAEKLKNKVTVIWHVVEKTGAAGKFIHFNDGKIALTPCEHGLFI